MTPHETPLTDSAAATGAPEFGTLPTVTGTGSVPSASPPPEVPGYEILEELGRGGMGVVFKARQLKLNRLVALKLLPAGFQNDRDLQMRFRTEAEAVARLQHPNIVQIFEVGDVAGRPFLALEFVPGGTLAQFLARKPQDPNLAADLTESLARATHHAHTHDILHRDLKPGNILVSGGVVSGESSRVPISPISPISLICPQPKIADFGLAKQLDSSDGPTQMGDVLGTPSYMAPEQAGGVTKNLTPAVDVYALGAILYEMLTGRPPFLGATPTETVVQVLSQEPVAPKALRPDCPRDLQTICLKCLEKSPLKRYPTAEALADDLRRYRTGEPILARPAGLFERLVKWSRRNPAAATALSAALALLVLGTFALVQQVRHNAALSASEKEQRRARERAEANFQIARRAVKELLADVGAEDLKSVPQMDAVRRSLLQKALASMQELLRQDADNPAVRRQLAQTEGDIGEIYEMLGEPVEAEQHLRAAVAAYRELARPRRQSMLDVSLALMKLATFLTDVNKLDEAERLFQEALAFEVYYRPADDEAVLSRCRIMLNQGQLLTRLGRPQETEKNFARVRDDLKQLLDSAPDSRQVQEQLAVAQNNLGVHYRASDRLVDAAAAYSATVDLYRNLAEHHPGERRFHLNLGISARNLGYAEWWREKNPEAERAYKISLDVLRRLVRDFPLVIDYRLNLASTLEHYGEMLDYAKDAKGRELTDEARTIKEQIAREQPQRPEYQWGLGRAYVALAASARRREDWVETSAWETKAIARYRTATAANPTNPRYYESLRIELMKHAATALELKRNPEATAAVGDVVALSARP